MSPIALSVDTGFPWEAVATGVSGALAVAAASFVAIRQIGLTRRQIEIQEALAEIEAAKLRADLFDRRFAIYETAARFSGAILRDARFPPDEVQREFQLAMDRARLLFKPSVAEGLRVAWGRACDLMAATDSLDGERDPAERHRLAQRKRECMSYFVDFATNLSDIFGDELRLGSNVPAERQPKQ